MTLHTNEVPVIDMSNSPTGCCPVFDPQIWDGVTLQFDDKRFMRVTTRSVMHIPVDMAKVFTRAMNALDANDAADGFLVLSRDLSPFKAEHLFAVNKEVPGFETVRLSGTFCTKVFEGPFSDAGRWHQEMVALAASKTGEVYFFYTTCPKCAKAYGKNYVVGLVKVA